MQPKMQVEEVPPADAAWDRYVVGHARACGYHWMAWKRIIETVFGHRAFYLTGARPAQLHWY